MVCKKYLRRTEEGPSRRVKEQQEGISPNHLQAIFGLCRLCDKFCSLTVYIVEGKNRQREKDNSKYFIKLEKSYNFFRPRDNETMHLKWQRNLPHWWFWKWLQWFWNPFSHARKWCSQIHTWGLKYPAQKKPILSISWIDFSAIFIQDYFRVPWLHRQPFLGHLVV